MKKTVYFLLCLLLVWMSGFLWFYGQIPTRDVQAHFGEKKDAIIVLTGGAGRFGHGLELLSNGLAQEMLVSGVGKEVRPQELAQIYGIELRNPSLSMGAPRIFLDHEPENTVGNAQSTALWMHSKGFRSLYLVTSSYHMPRSLMEFRRAMPDAAIAAEPVFPEWEDEGKLLLSRGPLRLLLLEFHKYIARRIYYALPRSWQFLDAEIATPDISRLTPDESETGHDPLPQPPPPKTPEE